MKKPKEICIINSDFSTCSKPKWDCFKRKKKNPFC